MVVVFVFFLLAVCHEFGFTNQGTDKETVFKELVSEPPARAPLVALRLRWWLSLLGPDESATGYSAVPFLWKPLIQDSRSLEEVGTTSKRP